MVYLIYILHFYYLFSNGGFEMLFVRTDELRPGMRLAKPIYNKNGVLLYERKSRLTIPGINSVRNFGLIGIYILEPAEPVPPFSKEDMEFEQAQTVFMFKLRDILDKVYQRNTPEKLPILVEDVLARYGSLNHRVNFNQNLRSADDFIYKHAISTAILTAMISQHIKMSEESRQSLIAASLLYGFGYRFVPRNILDKVSALTDNDQAMIQHGLEKGVSYLRTFHEEFSFLPKALSVAEYFILSSNPERAIEHPAEEILLLAEILRVAREFDLLTGMSLGHAPESEIMAMQHLREHPEKYNESLVSLLAKCIHIIPAGASVDLSTKDKGIVLVENPEDYLKPLILRLSDNQLYDLSLPEISRKIWIVDLMKTMDNRIEIDEHTLKLFVADQRLVEMTQRIQGK